MDTAGLRLAQDAIEEEGVRRTQDRLAQADFAIWVVDGSEPLRSEDLTILRLSPRKTVIAVNKNDLPPGFPLEICGKIPEAPFITISALLGLGIDSLKEAIRRLILNGKREFIGEILSNLRHKRAIEEAREALFQALKGLGRPFFGIYFPGSAASPGSTGGNCGETTPRRMFWTEFSASSASENEPTSYRIDKEGRWFFQGEEITHRKTYLLYNRHLTRDESGRHHFANGQGRMPGGSGRCPFCGQDPRFHLPEGGTLRHRSNFE